MTLVGPVLPETVSPPDLLPGGERIVRQLDIGELVYESYEAGQWLTQEGEPAKTSKRTYLLNGKKLDSVSSIVGCLDKYALRNWIETQATLGAVQAERLGELQDVPEEDWPERIKSLGLGASAKKEEGQDRGHYIHTTLEALALGKPAPNPAEAPALARPWVQGAIGAWLKLQARGLRSLRVEETVCHPKLGYAGRPDLVCELDGGVALIDWKTNKGKVYPEAHYQTRLYELALRTEGVQVDTIIIVGIDDQGNSELIEGAVSESSVLCLLEVFRSLKRVNKSMAGQRKKARQQAKAAA